MNYRTHKLIAAKLHDYILKTYDMNIDREHFISGSVAPDVTPYMAMVPHTFRFSMKYIVKNLNWLMKPGSVEVARSKEFAYRLSIVMHYIADFFCAAHNDIKGINPIKHSRYELRLHKLFKNTINSVAFIPYRGDRLLTQADILEYLVDLHRTYKRSLKSAVNDFSFSMKALTAVTEMIVAKAMAELACA